MQEREGLEKENEVGYGAGKSNWISLWVYREVKELRLRVWGSIVGEGDGGGGKLGGVQGEGFRI